MVTNKVSAALSDTDKASVMAAIAQAHSYLKTASKNNAGIKAITSDIAKRFDGQGKQKELTV